MQPLIVSGINQTPRSPSGSVQSWSYWYLNMFRVQPQTEKGRALSKNIQPQSVNLTLIWQVNV